MITRQIKYKFMKKPILFITFNKIEETKKVFKSIQQEKPQKLYISSDGPRQTHPDDLLKVITIRNYILSNIDWPCKIRTLFFDKNLGCKYAVSSAISWFFLHEEMGIIIEDDCLVENDFFLYCSTLLDKYADDEKIYQINGTCFLNQFNIDESYFFSKYSHIWGWATWRRAWQHYEINSFSFESDFLKINFYSEIEKQYWHHTLKQYYENKIDTWDYPWTFTILKNNGLCIYPKKNMVTNIGFGPNATHTKDINSPFSNMIIEKNEKIIHPKSIFINNQLDFAAFIAAYYKEKINYKQLLKQISLREIAKKYKYLKI